MADANDQPLRIGARVVVELLRLRARPPQSPRIRLIPVRQKNAMAVLRDRLAGLQYAKTFPDGVNSVADALSECCSDLKIPLPVSMPDWGAILLLDQLFDRLLEQQLDTEARCWLNAMRLPTIRYALQDYSFFFTPQNLLRRFLNQLHLQLLSSSEKSRQVLRESLSSFLSRIQQDFRQDIGVCNRICIEAQTWFASHVDKVEQIEEKLRVQEISRRKERVAEPRVVRELNRIAAGRALPDLVVDFLHGEWRRSLLLVSMREGEEGSTWKRQIRITESLVELAQSCNDERGREKHRSFYPVLMRNIKSLLVSVNEDQVALEKALEPLELILTAMLNGVRPELVDVQPLQYREAPVTTVEVKQVGGRALAVIQSLQAGDLVRIKTVDGSHDVFRLTLKSESDEPWVLVSQSGKTITKKTAFQLAQGYEGGVLEIIGQHGWWDHQLETELQALHAVWQAELAARPPAPEPSSAVEEPPQIRQPEPEPALEPAPVISAEAIAAETVEENDSEDFFAPRSISVEECQAALEAIDQIQIGGWIIQQTTKGEERCKLAVKLRGRDKLIFVNRLGVKVLEIDRQQLAELLARGLISIVDTGEKFDNTLERVVRTIQEDRKS